MNYTKGEWQIGTFPPLSNYRIFVEGAGAIPLLHREIIAMIEAQDDDSESQANANLIAAAPDMYEALNFIRSIGLFTKYFTTSEQTMVNDALTKAEGKC